jgi:hypothetical protein
MPSNTPIEPTRADRELVVRAFTEGYTLTEKQLQSFQNWCATGNREHLLSFYVRWANEMPPLAQAIAEARAAGRAEERARLLANCTYLSYDPDCGFEEHDTSDGAKSAAEDALVHALDGDSGWNEGTEHISYGALVYFGRVVETSRRDATPEDGAGFDEYVEYELRDTEVGALLGKYDR